MKEKEKKKSFDIDEFLVEIGRAYSIPSNILPNTLAVSGILSFLPICEPLGSKYVVPIPRSCAATSNAHLVLVDPFSNINAIFFPFNNESVNTPFFFFFFKSAAKSNKYWISSLVKSFNVKKCLPFKEIFAPNINI